MLTSVSLRLLQDMLLKRAADIAEALYSVPRPHSQLQALPSSPAHGSVMGLGSYPSQLGVSIGEQSSQGERKRHINRSLPPPQLKLRADTAFSFPSSRLHSKFQQFVSEGLPISLHSSAVELRQRGDDGRLRDGSHDQSRSTWLSWLQQCLPDRLSL